MMMMMMMMMVIMMMIMMTMINFFFGECLTVERSLPSQISGKLPEVFETAKNLSLDVEERSCAVLMTNTP